MKFKKFDFIYIIAAVIFAITGFLLPKSGRFALVDVAFDNLLIWGIIVYIVLKIRKLDGGVKKNLYVYAVCLCLGLFAMWITKDLVADLIIGPQTVELHDFEKSTRQGGKGLASQHYYLEGNDAEENEYKLEMSGEEYDNMPDENSIVVSYYKNTKRLIAINSSLKTKEKVTKQDIVDEMTEYLEERYGYIVYDIVALQPAGWDHAYDLLICSAEIDGVEEAFCVQRYKDGEDYYCEDNYFGITIREEFENMMTGYVDKYFTEYKLFSSLTSHEGDTYPNTFLKFDDVISQNEEIPPLHFVVFIKESAVKGEEEFNQLAEELSDELKLLEIKVSPRIIYLNDEDFELVKRENRFDYYSNNIVEYKEK